MQPSGGWRGCQSSVDELAPDEQYAPARRPNVPCLGTRPAELRWLHGLRPRISGSPRCLADRACGCGRMLRRRQRGDEWEALGERDRRDYDEARIARHAELVVVTTSAIQEITSEGQMLVLMNQREIDVIAPS
jgi:hypothetical protein